MNKNIFIRLTIILIIIGISGEILFATEGDPDFAPGELIIKVDNVFSTIDTTQDGYIQTEKSWFNQLSDQYDVYYLKKIFRSNQEIFRYYYTIKFDDEFSVEDVGNDFLSQNEVKAVIPNYIAEFASTPNDEFYGYQWPLNLVKADSAWDVPIGNTETVVVGVMDTGVDVAHPDTALFIPENYHPHPDLASNMYLDGNGNLIGINVFDPVSYPYDDWGHGTFIAGIVAAATDNNIGIASLAGGHPQCNVKIMPIKITGRNDWATFDETLAAIEWAVDPDNNPATDDGADVLNMSFGMDLTNPQIPYSPDSAKVLYENVINYANDSNCLCVAASMNKNSDLSGEIYKPYPALAENCMAVAATDMYDNKASYSNWASWIEICAAAGEHNYPHDPDSYISTVPTHDQYSFYNDSGYLFGHWENSPYYDFAPGTSISSPFVASLAAVLRAQYPDSSNQYIRKRILGTSDDIYNVNPDYYGKLGAGRINAYRALTESNHSNLVFNDLEFAGNGIFECGETTDLTIEIKNWWIDADSVSGTLTTNDNMIDIINGVANWGFIGEDQSTTNSNPYIVRDNSITPRTIVFTLEITSGSYLKTIEFPVEIHPNINSALLNYVSISNDKGLLKEMTLSDIDMDGKDEIVFCATTVNPYINSIDTCYIYNYPQIITLNCAGNIDCDPAIGDIDNDGYEEIVIGNDSGYLFVWDYLGNSLFSIQLSGMIKNSILLEDVTGDGQLEIIVSTAQFIDPPYGIDGIYIIDPVTQTSYSYDNVHCINKSFSCADIDGDSLKEIILLCKSDNSNGFLRILNVSSSYQYSMDQVEFIGTQNYSFETDVLVGDIDETGLSEIIFGLCDNSSTPGESDGDLYSFHYYNGQLIENWCNSDFIIDKGLQIYKEQYPTSGLNIISESEGDSKFIDCNGNILESANNKTDIVVDIDNDGRQEFIRGKGNLAVIDDDFNEIMEWRMYAELDDSFSSISVGSVVNQNEMSLILISCDGYIYSIPIDYSTNSPSEWPQYQNNSRNTGCYFQPIPEEIGIDITVKHNVVIDRRITFSIEETESRLIIHPGNEILFKPRGLIEGRNVQAIGTDKNPIIFSGLCTDTTKNYWEGISISGCDDAQFEYCTITNAQTGLFMENTENNIIKGCTIMYNDIGISLFTSSPSIRRNSVSFNRYGIAGLHESMPILSNLDTLGVSYTNALVENEVNIFLDGSGAYLDNGYNDIYSTFVNYIVLENYSHRYLYARNNYWNSTIIEEIYSHLVPAETFVIEPICEEPNWKSSNPYLTPENQKLGEGYSYLLAGDYNNAATSFTELIETYPETHESDVGVVGLYSCYIGLKKEWPVLESYLDTLLVNPMNSETTEKLLGTYRSLSLRRQEEFTRAIINYESILDNNPSYEDSCYAVIDIGNTYLEAQYAGKSAMGKYTDLIPQSYGAHQKVTKELLKSIIEGHDPSSNNSNVFDKPTLFQSYPNPCFNTTNIDYFIPQSSHVTLKIYNLKGQFVKKVYDGTREAGRYSSVWDGTDYNNKRLGNGVYFYKLDAGKHSTIKKLIMMR